MLLLFLTDSHRSISSSTRTLISSGIAMAGWVSFSWMATCMCRTLLYVNIELAVRIKCFRDTALFKYSHKIQWNPPTAHFTQWQGQFKEGETREHQGEIFSFLTETILLSFSLHLFRQLVEVCANNLPGAKLRDLETADDVLQGGRHHKVFLLQTELFPFKELKIKTHFCLFLFCRQTWIGLFYPLNITFCILVTDGQRKSFHFDKNMIQVLAQLKDLYAIFVKEQACSSNQSSVTLNI